MPTAYVTKLNEVAEARRAEGQARREEQARAEAKTARERLTPLDERVGRLRATIPIEVQQEGLLLSSLQASLRGRWRSNCHPGELAAAYAAEGSSGRETGAATPGASRRLGGRPYRRRTHSPLALEIADQGR
jgi:hypothetical protein